MSIEVEINNTIYKIPIYGENKWGEETTALLQALSTALSNVIGPQDILTREALLSNDVSTPTPINGLKFDTSVVQNSIVNGIIVRKFPDVLLIPPTQDTFIIESASFEGKMEYSIRYIGSDTKVKIIGQDNGQFLYTSEDVENTESIFIKFYGKAIVEEEV